MAASNASAAEIAAEINPRLLYSQCCRFGKKRPANLKLGINLPIFAISSFFIQQSCCFPLFGHLPCEAYLDCFSNPLTKSKFCECQLNFKHFIIIADKRYKTCDTFWMIFLEFETPPIGKLCRRNRKANRICFLNAWKNCRHPLGFFLLFSQCMDAVR